LRPVTKTVAYCPVHKAVYEVKEMGWDMRKSACLLELSCGHTVNWKW